MRHPYGMSGYGPEQGAPRNDGSTGARTPLGGRIGATIMALTPFVMGLVVGVLPADPQRGRHHLRPGLESELTSRVTGGASRRDAQPSSNEVTPSLALVLLRVHPDAVAGLVELDRARA